MSSRRRDRILRGLAGSIVLFLLLEAVTRAGLVDAEYLPPASSVLMTTASLAADPAFLAQVVGTFQSWAVGLGLAILVAVPLGVLLGSSRRSWQSGAMRLAA
jgi:NitT/TauT family transport system permease protein